MKDFQWTSYAVTSPKILKESGHVRFCLLSDLHGFVYGRENVRLLRQIRKHKPDGILVGGDMILARDPDSLQAAKKLLLALVQEMPVWYALGNHEHILLQPLARRKEAYLAFERDLTSAGVVFLHNQSCETTIRGSRFSLYGLELEQAFFRKPFPPRLTLIHVQRLLKAKEPKKSSYSILLAHNPKYGKTYFQWGSDLILSGHYHGGIWRFSRHYGLAAPQALLFPRFCCGDFYYGKKALIVSAGLGEHTLPLRIHNPREVVEIVCSHSS